MAQPSSNELRLFEDSTGINNEMWVSHSLLLFSVFQLVERFYTCLFTRCFGLTYVRLVHIKSIVNKEGLHVKGDGTRQILSH